MKITLVPNSQRKGIPKEASKLGFGSKFSDHMFLMKYRDGAWQEGEIMPLQDFKLNPSAAVLHYAIEAFEGMKAFKREGKMTLFRPKKNAERMRSSARRLAMPEVPDDVFVNAVKKLVAVEKEWIPEIEGTSLYIRPTMIGTEEALGLRVSKEYYFFIICCPVGHYFAAGFKPIKIFVEDTMVRAFKGGVGNVKAGSNYAATLLAGYKAKSEGCSQVLWLDSQERKYVEEVGAMNMFFYIDGTVYTAPLSGTILPGVTRDSIIKLLGDMKIPVKEERLTIDFVVESLKNGKCQELFGSGTAAIVAPVGQLVFKGECYTVNNNEVGKLTQDLYNRILKIQRGELEDKFSWVINLEDFVPEVEDKSVRPDYVDKEAAKVHALPIDIAKAFLLEEETNRENKQIKYEKSKHEIIFDLVPKEKWKAKLPDDPNDYGFGINFGEHMVSMEYKEGKWHTPKISGMEPISLHPGSLVFHYAQEYFEGLKAFRRDDGEVCIFRPDRNVARANKSGRRLCMPEFDPDLVFELVSELVRIDQRMVPEAPNTALYIRPFMFATEPILGVKASSSYLFMVITSPVGPYFDLKPLKMLVEREYHRASRGGVGNVKAGGNYSTSLLVTKGAKEKGCDQVLWLDEKEGKYIDEIGAMNIFFVKDGKIVTSKLKGTVLAGVTRECVFQLAKDFGIELEERDISIEELVEGIKSGSVTESFGAGTAASISSVGYLVDGDQEFEISKEVGPITKRIYDAIHGIQRGRVEDKHGWVLRIPKE